MESGQVSVKLLPGNPRDSTDNSVYHSSLLLQMTSKISVLDQYIHFLHDFSRYLNFVVEKRKEKKIKQLHKLILKNSQVPVFMSTISVTIKSTMILWLSHSNHQHGLCLLPNRKNGSHRRRTNTTLLQQTAPGLSPPPHRSRSDPPPSKSLHWDPDTTPPQLQ